MRLAPSLLASRRSLTLVALCLLVPCPGTQSQNNANSGARATSSSPSNSQASQTSRTVQGHVVNALSGMAIPRALVHLNARQALTDSQGRFEFPQFMDLQANIIVSKPGYTQTSDAGETYLPRRIADLDAPVEVMLYPDALLTGIVTGSDGQPVSQAQISLRRANYDPAGLRWINAGFAITNSRGEYRFLTAAGRYRLNLAYNSHARDTGDAILPVAFPDASSGGASSYLELTPGEERHIDLRPRMGRAYPVMIQVDPLADQRFNLRFSALTESGDAMFINSFGGIKPGEYRLDLPSGSYLVRAQSDTREQTLQGSIRVTIAGGPVSGLVMHMAPAAVIPVELAIDPLSSSATGPSSSQLQRVLTAQQPSIQQFNLYLHKGDANDDQVNQDIPIRFREDKAFEFRALPGRYRLTSIGTGNWFVESATYGGVTDLLTSEILLAPGSAGASIRLVANNQRGNVHGQVSLPANVPNAWVYLFPKQPALSSPSPLAVGNASGFYTSVPVGSYSVVAFEHRPQEDLRNPDTMARLTAGAKTVDVTAGAEVTVNIELSRPKEITR